LLGQGGNLATKYFITQVETLSIKPKHFFPQKKNIEESHLLLGKPQPFRVLI
jgi:hypothetical protein